MNNDHVAALGVLASKCDVMEAKMANLAYGHNLAKYWHEVSRNYREAQFEYLMEAQPVTVPAVEAPAKETWLNAGLIASVAFFVVSIAFMVL